MDEIADDLYHKDVSSPAYLSSKKTLYDEITKKLKKKPDISALTDFLLHERIYTQHKQRRKKFPRRQIRMTEVFDNWQADLADFQALAPYADKKSFLLVFIDAFSKYAKLKALASKSTKDVKKAFEEIFDSLPVDREIHLLQTDRGNEKGG